jgi:hypothetical protein
MRLALASARERRLPPDDIRAVGSLHCSLRADRSAAPERGRHVPRTNRRRPLLPGGTFQKQRGKPSRGQAASAVVRDIQRAQLPCSVRMHHRASARATARATAQPGRRPHCRGEFRRLHSGSRMCLTSGRPPVRQGVGLRDLQGDRSGWVRANGATNCFATATANRSPCAADSDCAPGYFCEPTLSECTKYCMMGVAGDCPKAGDDCVSFLFIQHFAGTREIGYCGVSIFGS